MSAPSEPVWRATTIEATVGRYHLTVVDCDGSGEPGERWLWQVWKAPTDPDGGCMQGSEPNCDKAKAECLRHLDPKTQRAWKKKAERAWKKKAERARKKKAGGGT